MAQSSNNMMLVPLSSFSFANLPLITKFQPEPEVVEVVIVESKEIEPEEMVLPFEKWNLPPQPEGYIQYPAYDPL
ncbi:MAG: hypothetical protein LC128_11355 [Chitinophagales bacterium]|nr:hypothetical protein [Chitinophagales bacterium]